jgi:hypothetical protein
LRSFNGFPASQDVEFVKEKLNKYSVEDLKDVATFFNLERSGDKAHIVDRINDFISKPQDFGASKVAPKKKSPVAAKKKTTAKKLAGTKRKAPAKKATKAKKGKAKTQKPKESEVAMESSAPMETEEKSGNN